MSGRFEIDFAPGDGAVPRMLGLVERRGFRVRGIAMAEEGSGATLAIEVEPHDSSRSLEVLARQLRRLVEVRSVTFATTAAGSCA